MVCGVTEGPVHSVRCRERMTAEIAKSPEGQWRIAAASANLIATVEQLGNPLRSDLLQVKSELPTAKPTIV